ncbi:MAG TPA: hypothetical protein VNX68_07300, partial [Nitrosopumilaceae archaeon]|nr:hypothetical protein [Nitrosopumilaceae archaeon]
MKNNYFSSAIKGLILFSGLILGSFQSFAQTQNRFVGTTIVDLNKETKLPCFIQFNEENQITQEKFVEWATYAFELPKISSLKEYSIEKDEIGFTHTRYKQYVNEFPVEGTMVITHSQNGKIKSVNGEYLQKFGSSYSASLSEESALKHALKKINAKKYKWQNKEELEQKRKALNDPNFTYYPKGELVIIHKKGTNYDAANIRLAYKFNIYAEEPL